MAEGEVMDAADMADVQEEQPSSKMDGRYGWLNHRIATSLKVSEAAFDRLLASENRYVHTYVCGFQTRHPHGGGHNTRCPQEQPGGVCRDCRDHAAVCLP